MENKEQKTAELPKKELIIKVKHLIEYLQQFDGEISVGLDHDGWYEDVINAVDEVDLISKRGLFDFWNHKGKTYLTINN